MSRASDAAAGLPSGFDFYGKSGRPVSAWCAMVGHNWKRAEPFNSGPVRYDITHHCRRCDLYAKAKAAA